LVAGTGASSAGLQLMAALRPRLPISRHVALTLSAGWSMGPHKQVEDASFYIDGPTPPIFDRRWALAQWVNFDAGVEVRAPGGFAIRTYVGVARLLNVDDFTCTGPDAAVCEGRVPASDGGTYDTTVWYPFFGLTLGYAF
jgi:hypothetical protein